MSELQATLEFQVELGKFYNVDLFQRGYYQVRAYLKTPPKVPIKVEISLPRNSVGKLIAPASIINGVAVSKSFQILYRNEEVTINDVILFKVHMLVDVNRVAECLERADLHLIVELWFTEEEITSAVDGQEKLQLISQRATKLHFSATEGLHHHLQLLFDYFHLCVVTVTVHGMLIALHQPYIGIPKQQKSGNWNSRSDYSTLESVLFGSRPTSQYNSPNKSNPNSNPRLRHACNVHKNICSILLSSYESLQTCMENYISKLPSFQQIKFEHTNCHTRLEMLSEIAQTFQNEQDLLETAATDVAQLCAENVLLWQQFIEVVTLSDKVSHTLAKEHHAQRIKRFADGFFLFEFPKQAMLQCYEPSIHGHTDQAAVVRNSTYFQTLPPLSAECLELDGDYTTLPIIFEDIYRDLTVKMEIGKGVETEDVELTIPEKGDKDSSLERKDSTKSNATDTSSTHSNDSSPRTRGNKRRFIKNIKPETLKRPSFSVSNPEVTGLIDKPDCNLVGYKKVPNEDSYVVGSPHTREIIVPPVELGTFSPAPSNAGESKLTHGAIQGAISMPTLLAKGHLKMSATGSMPDLSGDMGTPPKSAPSSGSEPNLTGNGSNNKNVELNVCTNSGKHTDSSEKMEPVVHQRRASKVSFTEPEVSKCDENTDALANLSFTGNDGTGPPSYEDCVKISVTEATPSKDEKSDASLKNDNKIDYQDLANCLTKALGEPEEVAEVKVSENATDVTQAANVTTTTGCDEHPKENVNQADASSNKDSDNVAHESSDSTIASVVSGASERTSPDKAVAASNRSGSNMESISSSSSDNNQFTVLELLKSEFDKNEQASNNTSSAQSSNSDLMKNGLIWPENNDSDESTSNSDVATPSLSTPNKTRPATAGPCTPCASSSSDTMINQGDIVKTRPNANHMFVSHSVPELAALNSRPDSRLVSPVGIKTLSFISAKEDLKRHLKYHGNLYSDFAYQSSSLPYFWTPEGAIDEGLHLIVCVHGLDGNSADLRLVRTYLEMAMPGEKVDFLMSERNQPDTFADFEVMTDRLVAEILYHIEMYALNPSKISFIGHSLGNLIIRSALSRPEMALLLPKLHTFLSLSGPHLGTLYNNSGLVNMGMWFMQKWKKSGSLLQLSLKDHTDLRQSFLYKLSQKPGLEFFKNILLVGSTQDRYVPFHSSRIELCRASVRDNSGTGGVYNEMVANIMQPILYRSEVTLVRYDVFHALPNTANSLIGRAAHIAVLDSELFIEKFITVSALKYFK